MDYRMANRSDMESFVHHRIEFVTSIREINDIHDFEDRTRQYFYEHMGKDDLIIFLGLEDGTIAASCMACLYETAPLPNCLSGKLAELLNVYTKGEYRRKGHGEALLNLLIQEAKKRGVEMILLNYTDDGFSLYQKLGFTLLDHQMILTL